MPTGQTTQLKDETCLEPETTKNRVLRAAKDLVAENGLKVSTLAVADRAGLARMTVYRHFGTRNDLLIAVVLDETVRMIPTLTDLLEGRRGTFPHRLVDAMVHVVTEIRESPIFSAFADQATPTQLAQIDHQDEFVSAVRAFFLPYFRDPRNRGQLRHDPDRTLDYTLRQLLLHLVARGQHWTDTSDLRDDLEGFFVPAISK